MEPLEGYITDLGLPVAKPFCPTLIPLAREKCYSLTWILVSLVLKMGCRQSPLLTRFICYSRDLRNHLFTTLKDLLAGVSFLSWDTFFKYLVLEMADDQTHQENMEMRQERQEMAILFGFIFWIFLWHLCKSLPVCRMTYLLVLNLSSLRTQARHSSLWLPRFRLAHQRSLPECRHL